MPTNSYTKYYNANRDALTAKMRERDAIRREEKRQYLLEHPEEIDAEREKYRNKYQTTKVNRVKRIITEWLDNPVVNAPTKQFLQDLINTEKYKTLTPKLMGHLELLVK